MTPWRFMEYVTPDGRNPFQEWYDSQDRAVRSALDFTIHQLKVTDDWVNPEIKQFSLFEREHAGLGELRFWPEDGRKFRVAGLYLPGRREFVMFTGAEKRWRGAFYKPSNALDLALKYKEAFEAGRGHSIEHV